jgi:uncharacterized protein YegL
MSAQIQSTMLSVLQFTPPGTTLPVELFPVSPDASESPHYQFGVLEINTPDKEALPHTWDVKFDVDCSGSMSDPCMDGRTKLQHIKHVLANILRLFASYSHITFNVSIDAFDNYISQIFDFVQITPENVEQYIAKINGIHPRGQTNLVLPLENTKKQMTERSTAFPQNKRLHFLLTDGNDTCSNSSKTIVNAVDAQYDTIVFGFGQDHDSKTLMEIGDKPFCEYAFIAELEKAGIVYGEYIHNVLYRYVEGLTVLLRDAEIYCWKTNTWSTTLTIGNLASGLKKSYYIRTKEPVETVCGEIHGRQCLLDDEYCEFIKLDDFDTMPYLIGADDEVDANEFKDHSLRFKTLELLYEVAHLDDEEATNQDEPRLHNGFLPGWFSPAKKSEKYYNKVNELKEKILALYRQIRDYKVATYGETEPNTFLAALMDDLYIARRSFDHNNGRLYTMARQRTQGTQNVYTPSNIDDMGNAQRNMTLQTWPLGDDDLEESQLLPTLSIRNASMFLSPTPYPNRPGACTATFAGDETDILSHNISCGTQDDYASPRMLDVIRSTSDAVGDDDLV